LLKSKFNQDNSKFRNRWEDNKIKLVKSSWGDNKWENSKAGENNKERSNNKREENKKERNKRREKFKKWNWRIKSHNNIDMLDRLNLRDKHQRWVWFKDLLYVRIRQRSQIVIKWKPLSLYYKKKNSWTMRGARSS
jgi:hypothetical protein